MNKKKHMPSNEAIINKRESFIEFVESSDIKHKRDTVSDKLLLIKDQLQLLKDKNIPYRTLKEMIKAHFDLVVSEQTLRQFCQENLGFEKQVRLKRRVNTPHQGANTPVKSDNSANTLTTDMKFD